MASLKVPSTEFPKLKKIAEMPNERFDAILTAFKQAKPAIALGRFVQNLNAPESLDDVREILTILAALFSIKERDSLNAESVATMVAEAAKEEKPAEFSEISGVLRDRLRAMLELDDPIGITAKATDVLTEHQRTFCHARILSDIRPIFAPDFKAPEGAVIVHMLQIGFRENKEHKEFYLALDTEDIVRLKKILERAEAKTAMLECFIQKSEMKYIKV